MPPVETPTAGMPPVETPTAGMPPVETPTAGMPPVEMVADRTRKSLAAGSTYPPTPSRARHRLDDRSRYP